jgi:hypothetical protein
MSNDCRPLASAIRPLWPPLGRALAISIVLGVAGLAPPVAAKDRGKGEPKQACSATARLAARACRSERADDQAKATAICLNESEPEEREDCQNEAAGADREAREECREQLAARLEVCGLVGEVPYDPPFDPADFDGDFASPSHPNRWFPLRIGHRWQYEGDGEEVSVEVLGETKEIEGVPCVVVRDVVTDDGELVEDTDDWFAQARNGDVHYCGEEVKDFESFDGDEPRLPELVAIDGSFKAGRDGAKPGLLFPAVPVAGLAYRQEFALGDAEDVAQVLTTRYGFGRDPALDAGVPPELAQLLCAGDCVVTRELSPLEPGAVEHKYYARGIGLFLEVKPDTGEVVQLVGCNFDPRCEELPEP